MNYDTNNLRFGDPGFKFTRVKQGYNPEEVDVIIETQKQRIDLLARQNNDLINENVRLEQALSECNIKIRQLAQSTNMMEQERQNEKLRLAGIMTTAGRTAEETVNNALLNAEKIRNDANLEARQLVQQAVFDAKAVYKELVSLEEIMRTVSGISKRHCDRLDVVIKGSSELVGNLAD